MNDEPSAKKPKLEPDSLMSIIFGDDDDVEITSTQPPLSVEERVAREMEMYQREPKLGSNANPLDFWRVKDCYPILSKTARKLLSTQGSSVASERTFSTAGDIVSTTRSKLKGATVDKLIFLKKNITDEDVEVILRN